VVSYPTTLEIPGGGGSYRPKFLKESMSLNWNFQRGGGFKAKKPPWGGIDIFWNKSISIHILL